MAEAKNVLGEKLEICCTAPMTGFYRTGTCETGPQDVGTHVICAQVTQKFLTFTASRGNDLMTPAPVYGFPGFKGRGPLVPMRQSVAGGPGSRSGPASDFGGDS